ncbi:hypothetical protein HN51_066838 [Arachis hypogaea]|uniref:Transmembrane protein n=1 Tax=Arachis hypogaea TaxID=3818 RepID=A0A444ZKT9_ARAHY|nr:uncharacterized protein LOC107637937 [Arachis ipaensis]XP_025649011.1 uncharacterized protein LOC112743849 [Arachis hypogaea]QHO08181.1 uncharacterized protein DS421_14g470310 [Arachis hypogaea]RYR14799.1 hypothetical protein Ahy_B04g071497 [Arachis hypogaea]
MAANVTLSSPFPCKTSFLPKSPSSLSPLLYAPFSHRNTPNVVALKVHAKLGGGDEEGKKGGKKKFITRDEEPQQYWQTAGEREGENPMKTPLPYIIIFGMSTPFVILAIAFANGWIKVPVR